MYKTDESLLERESAEPSERLKRPEDIVHPDTFEAMAEALNAIKGWPLYLMTGTEALLSQKEVLAAWIMGVESIRSSDGGTMHILNPDVLAMNAHLGGEKRDAADQLLDDLAGIEIRNARSFWEEDEKKDEKKKEKKKKIDHVIREAEIELRLSHGKSAGTVEHDELVRLNAAKAIYNLTYPNN